MPIATEDRKAQLRSLLSQLESAPPTLEREALIREVRRRLLAVDGLDTEPSGFGRRWAPEADLERSLH